MTIDSRRRCLLLQAREDQPRNVRDSNLRHAIFQSNVEQHRRNIDIPAHQRSPMYKDFSTSFVRSAHRQLYGYFEIYCKVADSDISSGFWLAHNEPSPHESDSWWTQLDVFQYSTSTQKSHRGSNAVIDQSVMMNTNHHVHRFGNNLGRPRRFEPRAINVGENLSLQPHKFAIDWNKDYIAWYFDDRLVRREPNDYFHRPMHLQLDRETFPNWFGLPRNNGVNNLPNFFEVYHIRTWQRVSA